MIIITVNDYTQTMIENKHYSVLFILIKSNLVYFIISLCSKVYQYFFFSTYRNNGRKMYDKKEYSKIKENTDSKLNLLQIKNHKIL